MNSRDKRELKLYSGAIALFSIGIAHMFYTAWTEGAWRLVVRFADLTSFSAAVAGNALLLIGAGIYAGFLALFANDFRKRYQGFLLLLGSVVVVAVLAVLGIGVPNFQATLTNIASFSVGMALALCVEVIEVDELGLEGELRYLDLEKSSLGKAVDDRGNQLEFRAASLGLLAMIVGLVTTGNILNIIQAGDGIGVLQVAHLGVSAVFLYFLYSFIELDIDPDTKHVEIIGPTQSGKTYLTLGLLLTAKRLGEKYKLTHMNAPITELVQEHQERAFTRSENQLNWDIANTLPDKTYNLEFELITNTGFPTKARFNIVDYAGEHLKGISHRVDNSGMATDGGRDPSSEDNDETNPENEIEDILEDDAEIIQDQDSITRDSESNESSGSNQEADESIPAEESGDESSKSSNESGFPDRDNEQSTEQSDNEQTEELDSSDIDIDSSELEYGGHIVNDSSELESEDTEAEQPNKDSNQQPDLDNSAESEETETTDEQLSSQDVVVEKVAKNIEKSDKLVMLLDCERFLGEAPAGHGTLSMQIDDMNRIANNTSYEEVILVATKADLLISKWQKQRGFDTSPEKSEQRWDDFREFVTNDFHSNGLVGGFMETVDASRVLPVYFQTEKRDGDLMPAPDENGELQPEGFDDILSVLVEDS